MFNFEVEAWGANSIERAPSGALKRRLSCCGWFAISYGVREGGEKPRSPYENSPLDFFLRRSCSPPRPARFDFDFHEYGTAARCVMLSS